jgi:hypothetical protein
LIAGEESDVSHQLSIYRETAFSPTNYQNAGRQLSIINLKALLTNYESEGRQLSVPPAIPFRLIVGGRESCFPAD